MVVRVHDLLPDPPQFRKELTFKSSGKFCLVDYQFVDQARTVFCRGDTSFQIEEIDGVLTKVGDRTDEQIERFIFEIASDGSATWAVLPGQSIVPLARKQWLEINSVEVSRTPNGNELLTVSWSQKHHEGEPNDSQGTVTYDPSQDWQIVASSIVVPTVAARTESTYSYSKMPHSEEFWIHSGTHKTTEDNKVTQHWQSEVSELIPTAPDKSTFEITSFALARTPSSSSDPEPTDGGIKR